MKTKYIHFGLLAVAAVIVLWYLLRNRSAAAAAPAAAAPGQTPAVAPVEVKLGDVNIGNQPPFVTYGAEVGDGPNSACDCGAAGQPVNYPVVSPSIFQSSADDFKSFIAQNGFSAPVSSMPGTATPAKPAAAPKPAPRPVGVIHAEVA